MSAPRKIWVDIVGESTWMHVNGGQKYADDALYHHDDVVRELVEAAQRLVGHDEWGTRKYTDDGMWADGEALRAALAKFAQEG